MGFFKRLLGGAKPAKAIDAAGQGAKPEEHAVILNFRLEGGGSEMAKYHGLQDELRAAIAAAGAGELDGDLWGEGECVVYTYGPDAERLWQAMEPVLARHPFPAGSHAIKRFGGPDSGREESVDLGWAG